MRSIPLSKSMVALVDDEDFDFLTSVGRWHARPDRLTHYASHAFRLLDGRYRNRLMHSVLTGWPLVDHINGNGLDNRRANLRAASSAQNSMNRQVRSDSRSGLKGVHRRRQRDGRPADRWGAHIQVDGRRVHLGSFRSPIEAAAAYDAAARQHFGEFARLNFPGEVAA